MEEFELLCRDDVREAVERNIDRDPVAVALDKRVPCASVVATQVKYLQRARRKLPSYFAARCIVPSLAFGQSSSEECAEAKMIEGDSVLDLTCGLGVDSFALSRRFGRVVSVERSEVLAAVARENFSRLGVKNAEVVCDSAEHFVQTVSERFDWCFADPDRRGADGSKRVLIEDCSPDMFAVIPVLMSRGIASRFLIKLSPMFDVDEALRLFSRYGRCSVSAVSLGDECKEVLVRIDDGCEPSVSAIAVGRGAVSFPVTQPESDAAEPLTAEYVAAARYLIVPDVALQKARLVRRSLRGEAVAGSENGFAFAVERPSDGVLGRVLAIERAERYDPRRLRRELKGCGAEILLRDVPLTKDRILKAAGLHEGSDVRMAFTSAAGEIWAIRLK